MAAQYDGMWDTSRVGTFEFTSVGAIVAQSHLQDFPGRSRFYFPVYTIITPTLALAGAIATARSTGSIPCRGAVRRFAFASEIQEGTSPAATNSDSAFSWMLGGGVEYPLTDHFSARGNVDLSARI